MVIGDGVLTPCISVLSAVGGIGDLHGGKSRKTKQLFVINTEAPAEFII